MYSNRQSKTPWVVAGGKIGELGHCTRCGEGLQIGGSQRIEIVTAAMNAFVKIHSTCRDTGRVEPKPDCAASWLHGRDTGTSSFEKLRARVEECLAEWIEEYGPAPEEESDIPVFRLTDKDVEELRGEVNENVLCCLDEDEHEARKTVSEFSHKIGDHVFEFSDSWEWECRDYTYHFIWCCYAIAWAVNKYDLSRKSEPMAACAAVS